MAGLQKILIIEDNPQLREIYKTSLSSEGLVVETAYDGLNGLEKVISFEPDLIFLDIMMPGMSGLEVLEKLRTDPQYKCQKTKVVILTNLGQDDRIDEALRKQADGYAVKVEINTQDLLDIIHSFERPPEQQSKVM